MNIVGELKWYLGNNYAHLKFSESKEAFFIDTVMVPSSHRSRGIGTYLINHVLTLADNNKKVVRVSARPIGNLTEERLLRLISYYVRFGFVVEDRGLSIAYMVRKRKSPDD